MLGSVLIISVLSFISTRNFDKKTLRDKITVLIIRRRVMMWHRSCPISVEMNHDAKRETTCSATA